MTENRGYTVLKIFFTVLCLSVSAYHFPADQAVRKKDMDRYTRSVLTSSQEIYLHVLPHKGDGWIHLSKRYTDSRRYASHIRKDNGNNPRLFQNRRYKVSFDILSQTWKQKALQSLFPEDHRVSEGWEHVVVNESLWRIAEWFTGAGKNYKIIREFNVLATLNTKPGQKIIIPNDLLIKPLRIITAPKESGDLEYKADHAVYRLKKGEALYTSVVVRFTGNMNAQDVNELALEYAHQSGIKDVRKIPVGYPIRIPYDDLLPQYLPESDPRRQSWEEKVLKTADLATKIQAVELSGIHVILDAGHGGRDTGALKGGVWESTYVYDILCRVKQILEEHTGARVHSTIMDLRRNYEIINSGTLPQHRQQVLLTHPRYDLSNVKMGVNLRWYVVNDIYRDLQKQGIDKNKIVFMSIHADALHSSIRGVTIYIPGAEYYQGNWSKGSGVYAAYEEVKNAGYVNLSRKERLAFEAQSRSFSRHLIEAFSRYEITVLKYGPIRENITRRRRRWVPAVIRYNLVPTRILLEVCNLNNSQDRQLLLTEQFRQDVAESVVKALMDYYGVETDMQELLASQKTLL